MPATSNRPVLESLHGLIGTITAPSHYSHNPCEISGEIVGSSYGNPDELELRCAFGSAYELIERPYHLVTIAAPGTPCPRKNFHELDN